MGKVYLVGAGPGDAGLITVKGLEKIRQCDAIIYDRLANEELLEEVPVSCEKIYVGKQAGSHYRKQEEINEILVECAKRHDYVVRLKGGDSFVFGRGGEEIEVLQAEGIAYEVIPGVTSAIAVPECAGIPVTHRGVSRSFHVITGHTKTSTNEPDYDYDTIAKMEGTVVFLMGLSNLSQIAKRLIDAGKEADTPVAVISDGTTCYQRKITGTLETIAGKMEEAKLPSPAVIVIGDTAALSYCDQAALPKVGITASGLLWHKLKCGVEELSMQPVLLCDMEVVQTKAMEQLSEEMQHLAEYDWLMFTSQNAIRLFFERMRQLKIDIRTFSRIQIAVLGSGTAAKLSEYGLQADFVPSAYTIDVLAKEFAEHAKPGIKVLIPRAVQGNPNLVTYMEEQGIRCTDLPIYDVQGKLTKDIRALPQLDYLIFVSASGVSSFFEGLRGQNITLPDTVKMICIGHVTKQRLLEECGRADAVALVNDVPGVLQALHTL